MHAGVYVSMSQHNLERKSNNDQGYGSPVPAESNVKSHPPRERFGSLNKARASQKMAHPKTMELNRKSHTEDGSARAGGG